MKYLDEYRDAKMARYFLEQIRKTVTKPWSVMEICGGQTHSLVRNGILDMLPEEITMIHGPGCPVCVTPQELIDQAVALSMRKDTILCSFGDMLRVPGSGMSLLKARAAGGRVEVVYSPTDAVKLAGANPEQQVVFFAVGFETTAPANALSVLQARALGLTNYYLLSSQVLVPPAMHTLLSDEETRVDGFLAAGHVCTVMGTKQYQPIVDAFKVPVVVTGFEPVDLLRGLYHCICMLERGEYQINNQYGRAVSAEGNVAARQLIDGVFEVTDRAWRGFGMLPDSGLALKAAYQQYDASCLPGLPPQAKTLDTGCMAAMVLKGLLKPAGCPYFGGTCTPEHPLGAPMVSSEGACAAYYNFAEPLS